MAPAPRMVWHILTGEYLPAGGGVAGYTTAVAERLAAAGDEVHVWVPQANARPHDGVHIHVLSDHFGRRSRAALNRGLADSARPARVLVQYVPHAFGLRALNIPFCLWLYRQRRVPVWVMFHEVAYPLERGQPFRHTVLALGNRAMAWLVGRAAERILVSTTSWIPLLRRLVGRETRIDAAPIFTNIPVVGDRARSNAVRARFARPGQVLIGHFGSFGGLIAGILAPAMTLILRQGSSRVALLIGAGSEQFARELVATNPDLGDRIHATGELDAVDVSAHIDACDIFVQPYPDGVCTRRGSATALLAHGAAVVTTAGKLTEPIWAPSGAVVLAEEDPAAIAEAVNQFLLSTDDRALVASKARALYGEAFDVRRAIDPLLERN